MKRLVVFSFLGDTEALVARLMRARCVDICVTDKGEGTMELGRLSLGEEKAAAARALEDTKTALSVLAKYSKRKKSLLKPKIEIDTSAYNADGRREAALGAVERTLYIGQKTAQNKAEIARLESELALLAPWQACEIPLDYAGSKSTVTQLGTFPAGTDADALIAAADEKGYAVQKIASDKAALYASVTCLGQESGECEAFLSERGFVRLSFGEHHGLAAEQYAAAKNEIAALEEETKTLQSEYPILAESLTDIEILCDLRATEIERLSQMEKLGSTKETALLCGWVPADKQDKVAAILEKRDCAFEIRDPLDYEEPPILLKNNKFAQNFEWVLGMYSYPKYGRFDPTFVMSIFYMIIFGLMFADVGYGVILMAACFGGVKLLKPQEGMKRFLLMFGYCGISCTVMGLLFGGWFGDFPQQFMSNMLGIQAPAFLDGLWMSMLDEPVRFLVVSLGIGALHLIAGMAVKGYILIKDGHVFAAIFDIGSWWVLFAGLGLLALKSPAAVWVTVAGALLLICTQGRDKKGFFGKLIGGVGSLYDIVSYASDLLSYSRILALGLASAVIAKVINILGTLNSGVGGFIAMVVIFLFGHVLNMAINLLGTFVHTARLQYIEFFGKFYEDGGVAFKAAKDADAYILDTAPEDTELPVSRR